MRRSAIRRKAGLKASKQGMKRAPVRPVNRKRRQTEFARCYHSRERVRWMKALPCIVCLMPPSDNAHVRTDGAGRKAGYAEIVPLCRSCHRDYDEHRLGPATRAAIQNAAASIDAMWHEHTQRQEAA